MTWSTAANLVLCGVLDISGKGTPGPGLQPSQCLVGLVSKAEAVLKGLGLTLREEAVIPYSAEEALAPSFESRGHGPGGALGHVE